MSTNIDSLNNPISNDPSTPLSTDNIETQEITPSNLLILDTFSISNDNLGTGQVSLNGVPLPSPQISLLEFTSLVRRALTENRERLQENNLADIELLRLFSNVLSGGSTTKAVYLNDLLAYNQMLDSLEIQLLFAQSDFITNSFTPYNNYLSTNVQPAVDAYNQAVTNFQAVSNLDPTSDEYIAAQTAYNTAAQNLNVAITALVPVINQLKADLTAYPQKPALQSALAIVNELETKMGFSLSTIPSPITTSPAFLPFVQGSPPNTPTTVQPYSAAAAGPLTIALIPPHPTFDFTYYQRNIVVNQYIATLNVLSDTVKRSINARYSDNVTTLDPAVADAYIRSAPPAFLESATGLGAGTSNSSLRVGLSNPQIGRILNNSLFFSLMRQSEVDDAQVINDATNSFVRDLMTSSGLAATRPALGLLANTLGTLDPNSSAIPIALSTGLAGVTTTNIAQSNESISQDLINLLQNAGLDNATAQQLAQSLTPFVNLVTLLQVTSSVGDALNLPDLAQTLISSLSAANNLTINPDTSLNARLANTGESFLLKSTLLNRVVSDNLMTENQAIRTINAGIDQAVTTLNANATEGDLRAALEKSFKEQGINDQTITVLIDTTIQFLNQDSTLPLFRNSGVGSPVIGVGTSSIPPSQTSSRTSQTSSRTSQTSSVPQNSSTSQIPSIQTLVTGQATDLLSSEVGDSTTRLINTQLTNLFNVQSPTSIPSLMNQSLVDLQNHLDENHSQALENSLNEYFSRHTQPNVLLQRFLDPGNRIIMSFMTGLMYDTDIPSNWQRPLDIQV